MHVRFRPTRNSPTLIVGGPLVVAMAFAGGARDGGRALAQNAGTPSAAVQKPDDTRFKAVTLVPPGELDEPMTFSVAKDGRVFINERRTGDIKVFDPVTNKTTRVGTIPINHQYTSASGAPREAEEGFVGFTLDPGFETNRRAYIMFADPEVAKHTIARIEMRDEMVDGARQTRIVPGSYKAMLEYPVQREQCCHTGGGMAWDAAGNLYITVGNNTSNSGGSQTDERPGRAPWDDQRGAANTNDLRGKILRIHPEPDGTYTIPAGNLFPPGTPGTRPEIYTMGHRNPWRVSVDSRTGYVYWGEVGPDNGTDNPEVGPRGYEEFNQARRPGFFGWPFFVANNIPFPFRDYVNDRLLPAKDPNRPTNTSVNNTGLKDLPPAMPAMIYYPSAVSDLFPDVGTGGRCAAGGPIYRRADFAAAAKRPWPAYFEGKWMITDCSRGWVITVALDNDSNYQSMERFLPSVRFAEPMDMKFGPEGDLYVLDYGSTWFAKSDDSKLVRIEYTAGNRTPKAVATADRAGGIAPVPITLSAAGSIDYDGDALRYEWRVQPEAGGATRTFRTPNPRVTFDRNGTYIATLFVTDSAGADDSASLQIVIGNEPPVVKVNVETPNKTFYTPGAPIAYSIEASDTEDGKPASGQVALGIDYVPEGFDTRDIVMGRTEVGATTRFAVAKALMAKSDCLQCHVPTGARVRGPTMAELAAKYKPDNATLNLLVAKVRSGGTGVWGQEVMPAHPVMSPLEARTIVQYLLSAHETTLAALPLAGTYTLPTSDVDSGRGSVVINAAYTDKGAASVPWHTTQTITVRRSPRIDPAFADVKSGIDLTTGRNQSVGVIPKPNGHLGFKQIDLTGIRKLDLTVQGGGRGGAAPAATIEVRLGSPSGELIGQLASTQPAEAAGAGRGGGAGAAQVTPPTAPPPPPADPAAPAPAAAAGGARGGRGGGGAVAAAAARGFPPATGPAAEAAAAPIGRGGGRGAGAGAGAGAPAVVPAPTTGATPPVAGAAGAEPQAGRGGGRGGGGAGGGGRGGGGGTPPLSIDLKPTTGMHDVYIVFRNDKAPPSQRLMTVSLITFVQ
jgi:cytochrome c